MEYWRKPILVVKNYVSIFSSKTNDLNYLNQEKIYEESIEHFDSININDYNDKLIYDNYNNHNKHFDKLNCKSNLSNKNIENNIYHKNDNFMIKYLLELFPEWNDIIIEKEEFWKNWNLWMNKNYDKNYLMIKLWKEKSINYLIWAFNMEKIHIIQDIYDNNNVINDKNLFEFLMNLKFDKDEFNFIINDKILSLLKLIDKDNLTLIYDFLFFLFTIISKNYMIWFFLYLICYENKNNMINDKKFQNFLTEWELLQKEFSNEIKK